MTIIASNDKRWYPAYAVLATYALLCAAFVFFSPSNYSAHLPSSKSFAAGSSFPTVSAFSIDAMWFVFPFALLAFSILAPFKLRPGADRSDIPGVIVGFLLFAPIALVVIGMGLFAATDITPATNLGRMAGWAAVSKVGLFFSLSFYFWACISLAWIAFVAFPYSYVVLSREKA